MQSWLLARMSQIKSTTNLKHKIATRHLLDACVGIDIYRYILIYMVYIAIYMYIADVLTLGA